MVNNQNTKQNTKQPNTKQNTKQPNTKQNTKQAVVSHCFFLWPRFATCIATLALQRLH
jgi:hypothetical protein